MKNIQQEQKHKYIMYCRKSSDSEDRQVQSIPDQIKVLKELAEKYGLEIVEVLQESKSAKAPGRPMFTKMIEMINKGEANGIIAWKLNRLARNPVDGGMISWMLQQSVIKHILTYEKSYYPTDNVLLMAVELGIANQYLIDLSTDTKRGLRARENEKGYPNGVAPMGFLNDMSKEPGDRGWIVDKERFPLIRKMFDMFATGRYSLREMTRIANNKLGLRTPKHKRQGGKKLVDSYVAGTLFRNPVYAGFFYVNKKTERRELNKEIPRMVSEEQYWHIQKLLGKRGRPRPSVNKDSFTYVGTAVCGNCGGSITAEHKYQLICSECRHKFAYQNKTHCPKCGIAIGKMKNPKYLHYIYNHCTKKRNPNCPEGSMREDEIDQSLATFFRENLCMSESLAKWCADNIKTLENSDMQNEFERKTSLEKTLASKKKEAQNLALMRAKEMLDDQSFMEAREAVKDEIRALEAELASISTLDPARIQRALKAFEVAIGISKVFEEGTVMEKKEALAETGSNLTIKDKKVSVSNKKLYSIIIKGLLEVKAKNPRFEPDKIVDLSSSNSDFSPQIITLLHMLREVRTCALRSEYE